MLDICARAHFNKRCRILNKLENEPNIILQQITEDCQRYVSVKQDSKKIEESGIAHIRKYTTIRNKLSLPLKLMNRNKQSLLLKAMNQRTS